MTGNQITKVLAVFGIAVGLTALGSGPAEAAQRKRCFGKKATITPPAGHGEIRGTPGDDVIIAGDGDEVIYGGKGDDRVCAGRGSEDIYGGKGDDKLDGGTLGDADIEGEASLSGGPGRDFFKRGQARFDGADGVRVNLKKGIARGHGRDRLSDQIHWVVGSQGDDVLKGTSDADSLVGAGGQDVLVGRGGDDELLGDGSKDGDKHSDTKGKPGPDFLRAGPGDDTFNAEPGNDELHGQEGTDQLRINDDAFKKAKITVNLTKGFARARGLDQVQGIENVSSFASQENARLIGNDRANYLAAYTGDDTIRGLGGNDHIHGEFNEDRLYGGPGKDLIEGGPAFDVIFGGNGDDELHASGYDPFQHEYYDSEDEPNELYGGVGDDSLLGNDGDDKLIGNKGNDSADGDDGVDDCDAETETNCP